MGSIGSGRIRIDLIRDRRTRSGVQLQHLAGVVAQKSRPHLVFERHGLHVGHDPLKREAHREIACIDDLGSAARVRITNDGFRLMLGREGGGRIVEIGPFQHQLDGEVFPRLAAVTGYED
jgi:hypothetical protein